MSVQVLPESVERNRSAPLSASVDIHIWMRLGSLVLLGSMAASKPSQQPVASQVPSAPETIVPVSWAPPSTIGVPLLLATSTLLNCVIGNFVYWLVWAHVTP